METMKNVSKMSLAAIKAWETRRKNAAGSSSVGKNRKKNGKEKEQKKTVGRTVKEILKQERVKDVSSEVGLKADESREMKALNGVELEQMAIETQKRLDRKEKMQEAKEGKKTSRSGIIGAVIKKAKIERFNGGVKVSGGQ